MVFGAVVGGRFVQAEKGHRVVHMGAAYLGIAVSVVPRRTKSEMIFKDPPPSRV